MSAEINFHSTCMSTNSELKAHLMRHSNTKNFKCLICEKTFYTNYEVQNHQVFHSNEWTFKCTSCGSKYKRNGDLQQHIKNKHK